MTEIDRMKKRVEMKRIDAAKSEMELRIVERLDEVERLKKNIVIQDEAIEKIRQELEKD